MDMVTLLGGVGLAVAFAVAGSALWGIFVEAPRRRRRFMRRRIERDLSRPLWSVDVRRKVDGGSVDLRMWQDDE